MHEQGHSLHCQFDFSFIIRPRDLQRIRRYSSSCAIFASNDLRAIDQPYLGYISRSEEIVLGLLYFLMELETSNADVSDNPT